LRSAITRAIQRRYGYKPVPYTCPECGHTRPSLDSFPASNILGVSALVWATSGRRWPFGATIHCPACGAPMTFEEEEEQRRGRPPEA
jgi:predicted RNA-binding Zn-ribbon protein involved in translation (DUF1610 family)